MLRELARWVVAFAIVIVVSSLFEEEEHLDDHQERTIWEVERNGPRTFRF